jgi:uncharacterized alkaline shock family protein YloU
MTQATTGPGGSSDPTTSVAATPRPSSGDLVTTQGKTSIADSVVQKIAGISAREVSGVYNLGAGASRAFGSIKERIPGPSGPSVGQGVAVEVGEKQAAIDLDVVVEYGVSIVDLAQAIRRNVINSVERMTGLQVTEVNIAVDDIHIPSDSPGDDGGSQEPSRVQ